MMLVLEAIDEQQRHSCCVRGNLTAAAKIALMVSFVQPRQLKKRSELMSNFDRIVLDIEGTTTSISFVYDTLFPFVRSNVRAYLDQNWDEIQDVVGTLRDQALVDQEGGLNAPEPRDIESTVQNVLWQMDQDRKTTGLKALQGRIWEAGYLSGELKGHVYEDVPEALRRWTERGARVYIYSSGSIAAQKLLFGNSVAGDLTKYLSGYFDTTTGPKREPTSYESISKSIGGERILFATDVVAEAEAAKSAGLDVVILNRPGNPEMPKHDFEVKTDFREIR